MVKFRKARELLHRPDYNGAVHRTRGQTRILAVYHFKGCHLAHMQLLTRYQFLHLFSDTPQLNFTINTTRYYMLTVLSSANASYSVNIIVNRSVSILYEPKQLPALRQKRPQDAICPPRHNALTVSHELNTVALRWTRRNFLNNFNLEKFPPITSGEYPDLIFAAGCKHLSVMLWKSDHIDLVVMALHEDGGVIYVARVWNGSHDSFV